MIDGLADLSPAGRAALRYARRGWHVFPLHTCDAEGRCDCCDLSEDHRKRAGKHPRTPHGHLDATTDPEQIRAWWRRWPDANIGCWTGPSGLAVLDVDGPAGAESLARLLAEHGEFPPTPEVRTPSGGRHLYFAAPDDVALAPKVGALQGLDVRAESSFTVLPPSRGWTGQLYTWTTKPDGVEEVEP